MAVRLDPGERGVAPVWTRRAVAAWSGSRDGGPADTILSQTGDVRTGVPYELEVRAWPQSAQAADPTPLPVAQRARLELQWQAAQPLGPPIISPGRARLSPARLDWAGPHRGHARGNPADRAAWAGQPRGRVGRPGREADLVAVPLTFLAEAPGELTIPRLRVTYDQPTPPEPPSLTPLADAPARPEGLVMDRGLRVDALAPGEPARRPGRAGGPRRSDRAGRAAAQPHCGGVVWPVAFLRAVGSLTLCAGLILYNER